MFAEIPLITDKSLYINQLLVIYKPIACDSLITERTILLGMFVFLKIKTTILDIYVMVESMIGISTG